MLLSRTFIAAIAVSSALAFAPQPAAAQADTTCPNTVASVIAYVRQTKDKPDDHPGVTAAALRVAEAYSACGSAVVRDHQRSFGEVLSYHEKFQYSEVKEASFRIVAARNLFVQGMLADARTQFAIAEKIAGDVADYQNASSQETTSLLASQSSRFIQSAIEIRDTARRALAAMKEAEDAGNPTLPAGH